VSLVDDLAKQLLAMLGCCRRRMTYVYAAIVHCLPSVRFRHTKSAAATRVEFGIRLLDNCTMNKRRNKVIGKNFCGLRAVT
jgi:hypothetical protein